MSDGLQGTGMIIAIAVTLIVGLVLFVTIAQEVGTSTNTITLANSSFTSAAAGSSVYLTDYRAISGVVIYNATGTLVPAANYTVTNNVVYNGALTVQVTTGAVNEYAGDVWNISGTAQPTGYVDSSGGRAIANLIPLLFALGIAIIALTPTMRSKLASLVGM